MKSDGMNSSILVVEDEADVFDQISTALSGAGFEFDHAENCEAAVKAAAGKEYDAIILDRILPDGDGLTVLKRLQEYEISIPTLVLSNLGQTRQRIEGLDRGADDYLTKPFDNDELVARIQAILRRSNSGPHPSILVIGDLEVHVKARTVHWKDQYVKTRPKSFDILLVLALNEGKIVSRELLWKEVWTKFPNLEPQQEPIEVAMNRLRDDLKTVIPKEELQNLLKTHRGRGYSLGYKA